MSMVACLSERAGCTMHMIPLLWFMSLSRYRWVTYLPYNVSIHFHFGLGLIRGAGVTHVKCQSLCLYRTPINSREIGYISGQELSLQSLSECFSYQYFLWSSTFKKTCLLRRLNLQTAFRWFLIKATWSQCFERKLQLAPNLFSPVHHSPSTEEAAPGLIRY